MATLERKEEINYILTLTEAEAYCLKDLVFTAEVEVTDSPYYATYLTLCDALHKLK